MRLVHFVEQGAVVGGVEQYLADLLAAAPSALEHVVVLGHGEVCSFAGRWPVHSAPWGPEADEASRAVDQLVRTVADPDLVCLFHFPPSEATLQAVRASRARVVMFCHDHRWWCPSATRYYTLTNRICHIRASTPACALRYFPLHCGGRRPMRMVGDLARATAHRGTLAAADAVLTASSFMAAEAALHGAAPEHTHVVPLPTSFAGGPARPAAAGGPPVLLFASRLAPGKGVEWLLDAFALMRVPAVLEIAGSGIWARRTERAVSANPARERIRLLGQLDRAAMLDAYGRATAAVVPSLLPEAFGLVGIEALAAGRPVVASGVGGTAEWARSELGVLVATPGDAAALATALDRVLADPAWAERARSGGSAWVRERHSVPAHVARLVDVLAPLAMHAQSA